MTTLNKRIQDVIATSSSIGHTIHAINIDILKHALEHNDCSPMNTLLNGLHGGQRVGAIMAWASKYAPLKFSKSRDEDGKMQYITKFTKKERTADDYKLELAEATPYWKKADTEALQATMTVDSLMAQLKALKTRAMHGVRDDKVAEADKQGVLEFVAKLEAVA